ncbi:MAG: hypothetical protein WBW33_36215 [Bryobacteraceae bacterium]
MKKQLIQLLEFLLSRVQGMTSDAQDPSADARLANQKQFDTGSVSGQNFPDITLAGVSALPGEQDSLPLANNQAVDVEPPPDVDPLLWALNQARWRLTRTEELLLNPLPDSIREASLLVEEVGQQALRVRRILDRRSKSMDMKPYATKIVQFQQQLSRVSRLLEGAKRVQWARIRWVGALVQTYTPGGRARLWNPFPRSWTVEM